jgi:hypothetical protein
VQDGVPAVNGFISLDVPRPCRYCLRPTYLAEIEDGRVAPLHRCCRFWIGQQGHRTCDACANFNARRSGARRVAGTPPFPGSGPNSETRQEFDEDAAVLRVLAHLRRTGGWVDASQLLPLAGDRWAVLVSLTRAGVENRGSQFRIRT